MAISRILKFLFGPSEMPSLDLAVHETGDGGRLNRAVESSRRSTEKPAQEQVDPASSQNTPAEEKPVLVYKYTRAKHVAKLLGSGSFAFPLAAQLNDPFESSVQSALEHLAAFKYVPLHARRPFVPIRIGHFQMRDAINPAYDDEPANRQNDEIDRLNRVHRTRVELLKFFRNNVGVLSLTDDPLSVVMWAHYGGNGEGICVGLDSRCEFFTRYVAPAIPNLVDGRDLFFCAPVSYANERPSYQGDSGDVYVRKAFFTKYAAWSYEKEVRVLRPVDGLARVDDVPVASIPRTAIKDVVLGPRSSPATEQLVRELVADIKGVTIRHARTVENHYRLAVA